MDPFGFLDSIFGDDGSGGSSTQGSPRVNQGFASVAGWMVGQAFAQAGPVGQYIGMVYASPGSGIPRVDWGPESAGPVDYGDYIDFTKVQTFSAEPRPRTGMQGAATADAPTAQSAESRTLEALDRGDSGSARVPSSSATVAEVRVVGTPPDRPRGSKGWFESYLATPPSSTFSGSEIKIDWGNSPPPRRARPHRPAARKAAPADAEQTAPEPPRSERDPGNAGPYFDVEVTPRTLSASDRANMPWLTDAAVSDSLLPLGAWERPEKVLAARWERSATGRIETVPTVPIERNFWDRGGTGLAVGVVTAAVSVAVLMWWNPVGWFAAGVALGIAGGVAATTASAVQLGASYGGATSQQQDADMNRAVSAALGFSSLGGALGSVAGTVLADEPQEGFEEGALLGGLAEGVASLPGVLRSLPGLWRAGVPWAKSLLLTPSWFFTAAGSGGGTGRSMARVFAARARMASQVSKVEFLGTTPLLERQARWARFQIAGTRSRNESVFRITYANGEQRIVLADRFLPRSRTILEAKYGNMGQMWDPFHETRILDQANRYIDITTASGGRVRYLVSTELGANRLTQRFGREFPAQMASGQLVVEWVPWTP